MQSCNTARAHAAFIWRTTTVANACVCRPIIVRLLLLLLLLLQGKKRLVLLHCMLSSSCLLLTSVRSSWGGEAKPQRAAQRADGG